MKAWNRVSDKVYMKNELSGYLDDLPTAFNILNVALYK